jgi:hypothetical protein
MRITNIRHAMLTAHLSCAQCCTCLSFSVLCPMLPLFIFLFLVPNVTERQTRVTLGTRHRKIDTGNIGNKTQKDTVVTLNTRQRKRDTGNIGNMTPNVTGVYLSLSCAQCYPFLPFFVLCPMLHVSIFLCIVSNGTCVYLSVSCTQCCTSER